MGNLKIPVIIDGFDCVEDMIKATLNYVYKGKTLKGWCDSVSNPKTNFDTIRAMCDAELAVWIVGLNPDKCPPGNEHYGKTCLGFPCEVCWLDWLRREAPNG